MGGKRPRPVPETSVVSNSIQLSRAMQSGNEEAGKDRLDPAADPPSSCGAEVQLDLKDSSRRAEAGRPAGTGTFKPAMAVLRDGEPRRAGWDPSQITLVYVEVLPH